MRTGVPASEETVALVRTLAGEFDDAQIARILKKQGRRTGGGSGLYEGGGGPR